MTYRGPAITAKQIRIIKMAQRDLGMDDHAYRDMLHGQFGVDSCKALSADQATEMIDDLKRKGFELRVKGKPQNMDPRLAKGYPQASRARQLEKIEALLTVGGKPWAYADALAMKICKIKLVAWVPDDQLYKIITALRKQAQREGWDLSGERS